MWLWILATLVAFYIKGLCGFANTLVFTSIMAYGTDNASISPVELILGFPTNLILAWTNRSRLKRSVYIPLSILVLIGSLPGAFLLKNAGAGFVKVIFGVIVILIGAEMLLKSAGRLRFRRSRLMLGAVAILSGVLCGLFGVGALLAAYVGSVTQSSDEFKANASAVFIVDNLFRLFLYSALGIITAASLKQALLLSPFMLIGLFAGIKSSRVLDEAKVRRLVILLLILSGFLMILQNLG